MVDRLFVAYFLMGVMAVFLAIVVWHLRKNSYSQVQRRAREKRYATRKAREAPIEERAETLS